MTPALSQERRHYSRVAFQSPATFALNERTIDLVVLDLSLKGALVRLPPAAKLLAGEMGVLDVHLNGEFFAKPDVDRISMACRVVHMENGQAGLLCLSIDLDSITHLRRLVELNLGDPQLLERELSSLLGD